MYLQFICKTNCIMEFKTLQSIRYKKQIKKLGEDNIINFINIEIKIV